MPAFRVATNIQPPRKYNIERNFLQEIADIMTDRLNIEPVKVVVSGKMRATRGFAYYKTRILKISASIANDVDVVDNTLRHEMAHFVAYDLFGHQGHGPAWKHACVMTGANPKARYDIKEASHLFKYMYVCPRGCMVGTFRIRKACERGMCVRHHEKFRRENV